MLSDTSEENLSFNVIRKFIKATSISTVRKDLHVLVIAPFELHMSTCGHFFVEDLQDIYTELS